MLRTEIETEIYEHCDVSSWNRTESSGLGSSALKELHKELANKERIYRSRRKRYYRRKICEILGIERDGYNRKFRKDELKQIMTVLDEKPDKCSWRYVLGWPQNTTTTEG